MARELPTWIGKDDDAPAPPRVKLRVFQRYGGTCQICFTKIISGPEYDHRIAIVNGGSNSEDNLVPVHPKCHKRKSREDVAIKSETRRTQLHHLGIKQPKRRWGYGKGDPMKKKIGGQVVPR